MLGKIVACCCLSWNVFRIHLKITKIIWEYLQIQMLYVFLNITPWLDIMKLLIVVFKKPLKMLIWKMALKRFWLLASRCPNDKKLISAEYIWPKMSLEINCTANVFAVKFTGFPCVPLKPCKVQVNITGKRLKPYFL